MTLFFRVSIKGPETAYWQSIHKKASAKFLRLGKYNLSDAMIVVCYTLILLGVLNNAYIFFNIEILTLCSKYCFCLIGMSKYKQNCWIHTVFRTPNKLSYGSKSISTVVNFILEKIQNHSFVKFLAKLCNAWHLLKVFL